MKNRNKKTTSFNIDNLNIQEDTGKDSLNDESLTE